MSSFYQRSLTGIVIIVLVSGAVYFSVYSFLSLCVIINLLGLREFYRLFRIDKSPLRIFSGHLLSAFFLISVGLTVCEYASAKILSINLLLFGSVFVAELFLKSENPFFNIAFIFLGILYITLPFIFLFSSAFLSDDHTYDPHIVLGYFFLLWAHDTGAYVCGSLFGKYPLFKRLSPHKTWEGSFGGSFFVVVMVYINFYFFDEQSLSRWLVMGLIVIVMGTLGDLVKSLMKRSVDVKDSGTILPGHGGILDRFDSLIGSAPFIFA